MENIKIVKSENWSKFYHKYLMINHKPTKNFNQLYSTNRNEHNQQLEFFSGDTIDRHNVKKVLFFYIVNGLIVGQITIQFSPHENDLVWLSSLSVDPNYKNQGISKHLIQKVFKWVKKNEFRILSSYYETQGELYSKHVLRRYAKEIGIIFYDKNSICSPYNEWGINEKKEVFY